MVAVVLEEGAIGWFGVGVGEESESEDAILMAEITCVCALFFDESVV